MNELLAELLRKRAETQRRWNADDGQMICYLGAEFYRSLRNSITQQEQLYLFGAPTEYPFPKNVLGNDLLVGYPQQDVRVLFLLK